ncbi:mitochondrial genome maintenance MGM101-domain-containing protein [Lineolata rhizophorae]|uniref:Mitochondrial genome maintenance protein MGM101 n=1 Tax=Lineolata rhizophorae TaxID=578093 RepID=A0A6A6NNC9_9PEZI|nr:mitochondrial genome maintenance MGM101-domain-containing protein [Lineolata rhizophorae]
MWVKSLDIRNASTTSSPSSSAPNPLPASSAATAAGSAQPETQTLTDGLDDTPLLDINDSADGERIDWSRSYQGLSSAPFPKDVADVLLAPVLEEDVEIKPDGIVYLPEIKYRRILNRAFGPGGWGLAPRGETIVTSKLVTREYGLVVGGRLVSIARGEQQYFDPDGIPTATEGCKSNALMRCCKDLGVASELWDPRWIRKFMANNSKEVWVEHVATKRKRKITTRKDDMPRYPFKEVK